GRADDLSGPVGDLHRGVVARRVEAGRRELGVDRLPPHPVAPLRRRPLQHDALGRQGEELLAAVRVLPVDQPVAVVVDAVAADLDRLDRRAAVGDHHVRAHARRAAVARARIVVLAVACRGAGLAARDRLVAAAAALAALDRAGIAVVAVACRGAGLAARDRLVAAAAALAALDRAGVAVVAVARRGARLAARNRLVAAAAALAALDRAGGADVAVARRGAR